MLNEKSTSRDIALHAMRRQPDDPGPTGMDSDAMFGDARDMRAGLYLCEHRAQDAERRLLRLHRALTALLVALLFITLGVALVLAAPPEPVDWPCEMGETCGRTM